MSTPDKPTDFVVWVEVQQRIASFHPIEGAEAQKFNTKDHFMQYLQELQSKSYRFQ